MKPLVLGILAATLLAATAAGVSAHGKATGIVMERMALMVKLRDAMKTLKGELALGGDYDPGTVVRAAGTVRAHSGKALTKLFPEGSTAYSEALPTVWSDPERFSTLAEDLAIHAGAMQLAAQTRRTEMAPVANAMIGGASETPDPATLATLHPAEAFGAVAGICSACHADYRMKQK